MSNLNTRDRPAMAKADIMAAWRDERDDELLGAVAFAAALVARADGRAAPAERRHLVEFIGRERRIGDITRAGIISWR